MVEVEEDGKEDGERYCKEDVANREVPEVDEPAPICGGEKCFARWKSFDGHGLHMSDVNKAREEDDRKRSTIVFDELPNISLKKIALANDATAIPKAEDQQGDHDGDKSRSLTS
jgi:hypothetical protein